MNRNIPDRIKDVITETGDELQKIYSRKMKGMILFGSYARGEEASGSDIDIALLLDHPDDGHREREKYFDAIWRISLKYDTVVSVIPMDYTEYKMKKTPLTINIAREGIRI